MADRRSDQDHDGRLSPSEHVRLEADLAARSLAESLWISSRSGVSRPRVLIVEVDPELRSRAAAKLDRAKLTDGRSAFNVMSAAGGAEAAALLRKDAMDVVICGGLASASDSACLYEVLNQDARFLQGAGLSVAADRRTTAAQSLREPIHAALVGEVLADLTDGWQKRAPPSRDI